MTAIKKIIGWDELIRYIIFAGFRVFLFIGITALSLFIIKYSIDIFMDFKQNTQTLDLAYQQSLQNLMLAKEQAENALNIALMEAQAFATEKINNTMRPGEQVRSLFYYLERVPTYYQVACLILYGIKFIIVTVFNSMMPEWLPGTFDKFMTIITFGKHASSNNPTLDAAVAATGVARAVQEYTGPTGNISHTLETLNQNMRVMQEALLRHHAINPINSAVVETASEYPDWTDICAREAQNSPAAPESDTGAVKEFKIDRRRR